MHTCMHTLFIKLNPTPITFYVAPNQCDYWETLNVRSPKKNKCICNILIFQNMLHSFIYTLTQPKHLQHKLPENNEMLDPVFC